MIQFVEMSNLTLCVSDAVFDPSNLRSEVIFILSGQENRFGDVFWELLSRSSLLGEMVLFGFLCAFEFTL